MTITRTSSPVSGSLEGLTDRGRHHGLRWALLIGIAVLVLAVVAGWLITNSHSHSSQPVSVSAAVTNPYAEGGSVYGEQVPAQAGTAVTNPYAEGGSVYNEQVPAQASTAVTNPYAEGGSVYIEQVPSAADAQ